MNIPLGFEVGTGARVSIPLGHTIVLGQTQLSGKTTTLQAMTERSGVCAIAFITKRGEKSFRNARPIPAYYTETSLMQPYWKFVLSMIESTQEVKLGFRERGWVMQLCQDFELSKTETNYRGHKKKVRCEWSEPKSLRDVMNNAQTALRFSKGLNAMICMQLVEYLKMAVPEIESAKLSSVVALQPGINVMDISKLSLNVQSLVVRSVVEWVFLHRKRTVVIVPEAWKFLPEGRSTPVTFPVEELIRQGAALQNFVWIDLQDLRGIKKLLLRSIQVWLFGVQREKNEVANTLKSMPTPEYKPTATDMMQLGIGQFIVAHGNVLRRVYVWPAGMEETHAQAIAQGQEEAGSWKRIERALDEEKKDAQGEEDAREMLNAGFGDQPENPGADARRVEDSGIRVGAPPDVLDLRAQEEPTTNAVMQEAAVPLRMANEDAGEEETMWKEKYEALRIALSVSLGRTNTSIEQVPDDPELATAVGNLRKAHDDMVQRIEASERVGETVLAAPANTAKQHPASNGAVDMEAIYAYVVKRAMADPFVALRLAQMAPEITMEMKRTTLRISDDGMDGRIARLISEKFFDAPKDAITVTKEFKRRGWLGSKTPNSQAIGPLDKIASLGFLTREPSGYQAVKGMRINILEAK
jgi:hypothetical protein